MSLDCNHNNAIRSEVVTFVTYEGCGIPKVCKYILVAFTTKSITIASQDKVILANT